MKVVVLFVLFWVMVLGTSTAQERSNVNKDQQSSGLETVGSSQRVSGLPSESFEGETFPPEGWQKITNFGGTGWIRAAVDSPVVGFESGKVDTPPEGGGFVALASWATGDEDGDFATGQATEQWLITPQVTDIQEGDSLGFSLKYFNRFGDNLDVWVSTGDSVVALGDTTFTQFDTLITTISFSGSGNNEWTFYTFALTDFVEAGSDVFVGFRERVINTSAAGDALFLDQVSIAPLVTSVADLAKIPAEFELAQNYPNPFNPATNIAFTLTRPAVVTLKVYNLLGQAVAILAENERYPQGQHTLTFDGATLPNGIYYYRIESGGFKDVKKMTLLK